jgi:hypothetical protein
MMSTAEKASQNATTVARRSVHQTSFLWAVAQAVVRSTTHRWPAAMSTGVPFGVIAAVGSRVARRVRRLDDPGRDPIVPPAPQGGGRAGGVGDARIGTAEDQHLHQLVEDQAIRDAPTMTAERMRRLAGGQQGGKLVPNGLDDG